MTLSYLRYVLAIFAGIQLASGQSLSGQQVLKSQDIPDGQVVTLDPSWFSDDTTDGTTILIDGSDLSVIIPVGQSVDPPPAFLDYNRDIAHQSLPPLLSLFGVDDSEIPALVEEAIPITYGSLTTLFAHGNNSNSPQFCTHGIFADASAWIDKVVSKASNVVKSHTTDSSCALFGAVLTPGFEGVANLFTTLNFISIQAPTTNDQDFYIYPLYNSISHDDGITVCYNAIFPPFFEILGPVDAVTMNKTIYVKDTVSSRNYGDLQFTHGTRILLHEFTHIKQYKALGYTRWAFGARYLFQFCKAKFDYFGISMEAEAFANEGLMDGILTDSIGSQFLPIYNTRGLQPSLGLPTATTYSDLGSGQYELPFQTGVMDIQCTSTGTSPPTCT